MPSSRPAPQPAVQPAVQPAPGPGFEELYLGSRRRLVLQAYALTGDLSAARSAVRDAFVAAARDWRKVGSLPDPEEWVRPRAWALAQRRHVARLWHKESGLGAEQTSVLDALHRLPDQQRKTLLLRHLAGLSTADIGRELGETPTRVEQQLGIATRAFGDATGVDGRGVAAVIGALAPVVESAPLPDAAQVQQDGRRRGRWHALAGVVVLVALTLLSGQFVVQGDVRQPAAAADRSPRPAPPRPVTEEQLLGLDQVRLLSPTQRWRELDTSDNTAGRGINTVCQATRFADPDGVGTFVRRFAAPGPPRRTYLQTVEISASPRAAVAAYRTTLGWFAGCSRARLQLLNAYRVTGLGARAQLLKLRIPGEVRRTYVVGLARSGALTVSTVLTTVNGPLVDVRRAARTLTAAVRDLCDRDPSGPCPTAPRTAPVLPPRSGEAVGTLAAADLPVVGAINRPWVGTRPRPARTNVAATTCDRADFIRSGAPRARTRTFLVPQARLPRRFGISETVGAFANPARARAFVQQTTRAMASCEKRDLGAEVSNEVAQPDAYRGSEFALWRLDSEIDKTTKVGFWMGVARVGRYVAQVNFTPAGVNDIDVDTFQALITRARDRLFELVRR